MLKEILSRRTLGLSISALLLFTGASISQTSQTNDATPSVAVTETFDGEDDSIMLGGQISFKNQKSNWLVYISDGSLVFENKEDPHNLHYDDIRWVKYPNDRVLSATTEALISATVVSRNEGQGGAGILVGSGDRGIYHSFMIDGQGRYHVVTKEGRNANRTYSDIHPSILVDAPNKVSFERNHNNIVFYVNGSEVVQVPGFASTGSSRGHLGTSGVGLTAFGLGKFMFDDIEINQPN